MRLFVACESFSTFPLPLSVPSSSRYNQYDAADSYGTSYHAQYTGYEDYGSAGYESTGYGAGYAGQHGQGYYADPGRGGRYNPAVRPVGKFGGRPPGRRPSAAMRGPRKQSGICACACMRLFCVSFLLSK